MEIISRRKIEQSDIVNVEGTGADKIVKRVLRRPLLNAFDIYKSNIYYGVITETEEEHNEIIKWYNSLLNLEVDAIENPPEKIIKYM